MSIAQPALPATDVRTIGALVTTDTSVSEDLAISSVVKVFEQHPDLDSLAVTGGDRIRQVVRSRFLQQLGRRFGYSLFEHRPIALLAEDGSTVDAEADPVEVIALATQREPARVFDDILVVDTGRYVGTVSMRALLAHHKDLLVAGVAERAILEERNRKLEEVHRIQAEFMANMTHELRSPLNTVLGVAQIMKADADVPARHRRNVEILLARGQDLLGIVNNILDLSRIESGAMTPLVEAADIEPLVEDLAASVEPLLAGRPVRLQLHVQSLPKTFGTDVAFLRRILTNLLSNAVKFTEVGTITIVAEGGPGSLTLRVCDTGVGIKDADRERLFARFSQLEATRTKRHAGTGLGLAIVKSLVDQLGGTIAVDSQEGIGARFTIRLPDLRLFGPWREKAGR